MKIKIELFGASRDLSNKDFLELSRSYAYMGNVFKHLGDNDKALENFNKALELSRITYNLNSESYTLTKLGDFYFLSTIKCLKT